MVKLSERLLSTLVDLCPSLSIDITGPFSTFNAFDLSLNLNNDKRRIDYVYYRNATPLNYVCNDKKYGGYYASDHLPVYSDMRIGTTVE